MAIEPETASNASYEVPSRTLEEEEASEPERERLLDAVSDQAEAQVPLPVATIAGVLAKARATLAVADRHPANGKINRHDYVEWLAYAALEDLARVAGEEA